MYIFHKIKIPIAGPYKYSFNILRQNTKKGKRKSNFFMHFLRFFHKKITFFPYALFTKGRTSLPPAIFLFILLFFFHSVPECLLYKEMFYPSENAEIVIAPAQRRAASEPYPGIEQRLVF